MRTATAILTLIATVNTLIGAGKEAENAPRVLVRATGHADALSPNAREEAIEDALRRCVEAGGGIHVRSESESVDFALIRDVILTKTAGFVERYRVMEENANQDGLYAIRVEAVVTRGDINEKVDAFKALLQRKGRPRVLVVGVADNTPLDAFHTAFVQDLMERRGMHVVEFDRAARQQYDAAELEDDPKASSLVAQSVRADVMAVVNVKFEEIGSTSVYGIEMPGVQATGFVKLIRADSAQVLASVNVNRQVRARTKAQAARKGITTVLTAALDDAIKRIAEDWLTDVDKRQGREVTIVMHKFPFRRTVSLVEKLRSIDGIKEVIIDETNADAHGRLRVITNRMTPDLAFALINTDEQIEIISSTKNQIDVR